ncbi:DUF6894 family protein [Lichenibacterium dinghuense]|uniref:DUF6894 family protein n=1 Tax=Lichenibacterium dinghuense TaxID=2895977 RepID=UPI001F339473|nr:hypothetical protein [Lichenibacterium sp. 6Y81]
MAHYFFDIHSRTLHTTDEDGQECVDRDEVGRYALRVLCDIARDDPLLMRGGELASAVRDATDHVVMTATLNLSTIWKSEA